ncbi:hypothetical protein [Xylophilus sp. GOD-11R]|uniref:hypothetical protein n=1 Tax=Xylophilus sp. GOD-11R TaxID=3089814 RepID=UPI00298C813E|nr:hypothetical protein [Xylophilus sp. GOD-11R]WPB55471.1 hypothetical protein R9X41_15125 [Xylophilus sp. GOD-11R]
MKRGHCLLCQGPASIDLDRLPDFIYTCCANCKDFLVLRGAEKLLSTRPLFRSECENKAKRANSQRLLAILLQREHEQKACSLVPKMVPRAEALPPFNACSSPFRANLWLT